MPDLILLLIFLALFQLLTLLHRRHIGPSLHPYIHLPHRDRFEWDRRAVNTIFQTTQAIFNLYILFLDPAIPLDYIYAYSTLAHTLFIAIIAFYIHDTCAFVMHPSPPSFTAEWIAHHVLAVALLAYNVSYRRCSAFPAAAFLISAAGHVPNDLRWWCAAMEITNQRFINATHLLCVLVVSLTCAFPPLYLLYKCARQLEVSVFYLFTSHMRLYCRFFFLIIYVPHLFLIAAQVQRAVTSWGQKPQPFRVTKID